MKIVSVISQKGGSGKTTIAENLAAYASLSGIKTALIDLDSQPTAATWGDRRQAHHIEEPAVISVQVARLPRALEVCEREDVRLVVIDTPPRTADATLEAARCSDLVLIPVRPSGNDLETLPALRNVIMLAATADCVAAERLRRSVVVINCAPSRGSRHLEAERYAEQLGFSVAPVCLRLRQSYGDAPAAGLSVQEYEKSGQAAFEFGKLHKFACAHVQL